MMNEIKQKIKLWKISKTNAKNETVHETKEMNEKDILTSSIQTRNRITTLGRMNRTCQSKRVDGENGEKLL